MKLRTNMKLAAAVALAFAAQAAVADSQHRIMISTMTPYNGLARSVGPGPPDLVPEAPRERANELLSRKAGSKGGDLAPEPEERSPTVLAGSFNGLNPNGLLPNGLIPNGFGSMNGFIVHNGIHGNGISRNGLQGNGRDLNGFGCGNGFGTLNGVQGNGIPGNGRDRIGSGNPFHGLSSRPLGGHETGGTITLKTSGTGAE